MQSAQCQEGQIHAGLVFESSNEAMTFVYGVEEGNGHKWVKGQTKLRRNSQEISRITLRCSRYRIAKSKHLPYIDPSDFRQGKSNKTNCPAHVNVVSREGTWYLSVVNLQHNHDRSIPIDGHALRPPTQQQRDFVAGLANATSATFSRSQISSAMSINGTDEHGTVTGILWQSPEQVKLATVYGDVIICDNSYGRVDNLYPLFTMIVIDGFNCSRNILYCFHRNENIETFTWILQSYLDGDRIIAPQVFVSDRHASLIASVSKVLPLTFHIFCIHHLDRNVNTNLRVRLGEQWDEFKNAFWKTYRSVSPEQFEHSWTSLLEKYPAARPYLEGELYECREHWAQAWVLFRYTCGIRTSGQVESEHRVNKAFTGPKKSLFQVFNALNERTDGQTTNEMIKARDVSSSRRQHNHSVERLFSGVLDLIRSHAGPYALQVCFQQMQESVFYVTDLIQRPSNIRTWSDYVAQLQDQITFERENSVSFFVQI
ncbi:hypothetical protein K435DRAFT_675965 [Dendrothele bispora CBS 962.96]|uniref:MULE transposase domain-containing protein n=1 Tax=Dendrothele bispora (strain CBS 962.96) TaxID=1314807 RepID=A0A4S8LN89_DENBC|nr:hypothetical protein K435DRAFT_675965 [Dendrothele bispora CBS 962.96]